MSNWISVEERLPEIKEHPPTSEQVFVTVRDTDAAFKEYFKYTALATLTFNGVWIDSEGQMVEFDRTTKVIGWMPLPEPMEEVV